MEEPRTAKPAVRATPPDFDATLAFAPANFLTLLALWYSLELGRNAANRGVANLGRRSTARPIPRRNLRGFYL
jgi:hypothetical protein